MVVSCMIKFSVCRSCLKTTKNKSVHGSFNLHSQDRLNKITDCLTDAYIAATVLLIYHLKKCICVYQIEWIISPRNICNLYRQYLKSVITSEEDAKKKMAKTQKNYHSFSIVQFTPYTPMVCSFALSPSSICVLTEHMCLFYAIAKNKKWMYFLLIPW